MPRYKSETNPWGKSEKSKLTPVNTSSNGIFISKTKEIFSLNNFDYNFQFFYIYLNIFLLQTIKKKILKKKTYALTDAYKNFTYQCYKK